jgi:hypothetical protein
MINPEVVGKLLVQHWVAPLDSYNMPRGIYVLFNAETGTIIKSHEEDAHGKPAEWRDVPELPSVRITASFYKSTMEIAEEMGTLM